MTNATIGMVTLSRAKHELQNNNVFDDETEKFQIRCTNLEAKQIMGMVTPGTAKDYENIRIVGSERGEPWGPVYLDSSPDLIPNQDWKHSGWYLIRKADLTIQTAKMCKLELEVEIISNLGYEYFEMFYTPSFLTGTQNLSGYPTTVLTYLLSEDFTTFDTTNNWEAAVTSSTITGASITASGNKLVFTGAATTAKVRGYMFTTSQDKYPAGVEIQTTLEWVDKTANYGHNLGVYITKGKPITVEEFASDYGTMDFIRIDVRSLWVSGPTEIYVLQKYNSKHTLIGYTLLSDDQKTPKFRWTVDVNGMITVYTDKAQNGTEVALVSNYQVPFDVKGGFYVTYGFETKSTTSKTMKTDNITITKSTAVAPINIVPLPVTSDYPSGLGTFMRASEDGSIPCVPNPSSQLTVGLDAASILKGCVQAHSTNNPSGTDRWITSTDEILDPTKFYVKNGLLKLVTTATGVKIQYWDGTGYTDLKEFTIGTCRILKLLVSNPEKVQFQFNRTKWTLHRGKQFVYVEHNETALDYTKGTNYYHDDLVLTSPNNGADVTMTTQNYCNVYETGGAFGMILLKQDPTTIKTNSIPASSMTAIGYYSTAEASNSYNNPIYLSQEFLNQPIMNLGMRQV